MATTVTTTGITFANGTIQTTAATSGATISAAATSGYTAYYSIPVTGAGSRIDFNEYSVARAISALGGTDLLCAIEFGYVTTVTSDAVTLATQYRARRVYRTVS